MDSPADDDTSGQGLRHGRRALTRFRGWAPDGSRPLPLLNVAASAPGAHHPWCPAHTLQPGSFSPMTLPPDQFLRNDGRDPATLRPVRFRWDPMGFALSSVTVEAGRTCVLCSVCVEEEVPRWVVGGRRWRGDRWR